MAERTHPELSTLMSDLSDLEKVQAAKDVAATIESPGWAFVVLLLERRRTQQLDKLVSHTPVRTDAEYAAALAEIRGMDVMQDAGRTVLEVAQRARLRLSEGAS